MNLLERSTHLLVYLQSVIKYFRLVSSKDRECMKPWVMSKLTFLLFFISFPMTILLYIWKQMRRPVMYWRWVLSPIWISILILFGEMSFQIKTLDGSVPICIILTIIFVVLKLLKKVRWKWGWTLCPIWFWFILNLGAVLHIFSINYLEPRGLPF